MTMAPIPAVGTWTVHQLEFTAGNSYDNPYADVEFWVEFRHEDGTVLRRPGYWDGESSFGVRFAAAGRPGRWTWQSYCSVSDPGLTGQTGILDIIAAEDGNRFRRHGFWRISPGGRSLVHADGYPCVLVADTAWALPWRATPDEVRLYAADRHDKGFNAALLMSVQPDMDAVGPRDRTADNGFDVGFEDLPQGHISRLNPGYFQTLDTVLGILVEHEIVPVLAPVFFGFGWKGLRPAGAHVPAQEYARFCRYLVARYGAQPAVWLAGADCSGYEPQVEAGGTEIHRWDCYQQPTGIHYRPHSTAAAHQDAPWLDFQWCQTGHSGEHIQERVTLLYSRTPVRAVANGEPTYENAASTGNGVGWWQGHEAWSNLCAGAMGVVYGAGSLWQWVHRPDEPGHPPYFLAPHAGWREALDFEGSRYVGLVGRILDGLPTTDMRPDWEAVINPRGLSAPGRLHIIYAENGRELRLADPAALPGHYTAIDPRSGAVLAEGKHQGFAGNGYEVLGPFGDGPCVVIFTCETPLPYTSTA
jgi:hypothetical protein